MLAAGSATFPIAVGTNAATSDTAFAGTGFVILRPTLGTGGDESTDVAIDALGRIERVGQSAGTMVAWRFVP